MSETEQEKIITRSVSKARTRTREQVDKFLKKYPDLEKTVVRLEKLTSKRLVESETLEQASGESSNETLKEDLESTSTGAQLSHIEDQEEKAEAYKELAESLETYLKDEREQSLIQFTSNIELIQDQEEEISDLKTELSNVHQQLLNTKELLNNRNIANMELKDVIASIPMFSGKKEELDGFINTCDIYMTLIDDKENLFKVIKAKITGEALAKISPLTDTNDWIGLKTKLKKCIKKRVSLEYATEDLNNTFQKKDENLEDYGTRIKKKLAKLNEASREITENEAELKILRQVNEKNVISKFEQNIRNSTIKVLVSAASKKTLDETITFAMQKELLENNKIIKRCTICGLNNHSEQFCRRANNQNTNKNLNQKQFQSNKNNEQNSQKANYNSNNNQSKNNYDKSNMGNQKNNTHNENNRGNGGRQFNSKPTHSIKPLENEFESSMSLNEQPESESELTVAEAIQYSKNE